MRQLAWTFQKGQKKEIGSIVVGGSLLWIKRDYTNNNDNDDDDNSNSQMQHLNLDWSLSFFPFFFFKTLYVMKN